jgi:group I intron endonuclease
MIIYKISNKINGKVYIGKTTKTLKKRWEEHCRATYKDSPFRFHKAIRKYLPENFQLTILYKAKTKQRLKTAEKILIRIYKSFDFKYGYNSTAGGEGTGPLHSEETKKKLREFRNTIKYHQNQSKRMKAYYNSPEGKQKQRERWLLSQNPLIKEKVRKKLKQQRSALSYRIAKSKEQKEVWQNLELRKRHSEIMKKTHAKRGYRKQMSISVKKSWKKRKQQQNESFFHRKGE